MDWWVYDLGVSEQKWKKRNRWKLLINYYLTINTHDFHHDYTLKFWSQTFQMLQNQILFKYNFSFNVFNTTNSKANKIIKRSQPKTCQCSQFLGRNCHDTFNSKLIKISQNKFSRYQQLKTIEKISKQMVSIPSI